MASSTVSMSARKNVIAYPTMSRLLSLLLLLLSSCSIVVLAEEPVSGGVSTVANDDPDMLAALTATLDQIRAKFPGESSVELGTVHSATRQIVAGNRWQISVDVKTKGCADDSCAVKTQKCALVIDSQPWLNANDLTSFSCS